MKEQNPFHEQTQHYVQQMKAGLNSILVTVRVRPLSNKQKLLSQSETIKVLNSKLLILNQPQSNTMGINNRKNKNKDTQLAFDYVFDSSVDTQQIYDNVVSMLLDGVFEGYNATILAYGATSCGKTYTMVGENEKPGIMALSIIDILNQAKELRKHKSITFTASYIQIYNENIKDLLISEDKNFELREDPKQGITISGITQVTINSITELKTLLKVGARNRTKQSTGCNQYSSRSHAILQIQIQTKDHAQSTVQQSCISKLSLVDLAGSERASNTTNKGQRMVEGAKINQSLLILGNCIQALSEASEKGLKNVFVPYRGSKLTRILKDSLGGNCRTVMIAHVTPTSSSFQETYNTIAYANRAKNIKNNAVRNILNAQTHITNYVNVLNTLKKENQILKQQLTNRRQLPRNYKNLPLVQNAVYDVQVKKYESKILRHFQKGEQLIQKIFQLEVNIQDLAFEIFAEQVQKFKNQIQKQKTIEAASLSKQKLQKQEELSQLLSQAQQIIHDVKQNDVLGKLGQLHIINFLKQKKIRFHEKRAKFKQEAFEKEKEQIQKLLNKIKKHLQVRDNIIEAQKIIIKKNNIISRITYSQLNFNSQNQANSIANKKKSENYYVKIGKSKQAKDIGSNSVISGGHSLSLNKLSKSSDKKNPRGQSIQLFGHRGKGKGSVKCKKFLKISQDTEQDRQNSPATKISRQSPSDRQKKPELRLQPSLKKLKQQLVHDKSDKGVYGVQGDKEVQLGFKIKKKKKLKPQFDFVFMPH